MLKLTVSPNNARKSPQYYRKSCFIRRTWFGRQGALIDVEPVFARRFGTDVLQTSSAARKTQTHKETVTTGRSCDL